MEFTEPHSIESSLLPPLIILSAEGAPTLVDVSKDPGKVRGCAKRILEIAEPGSNVGLCFRTSPDLIWWWFGSLLAGMRPLILQYPTRRQTHSYWESSVSDTIEKVRLDTLICDKAVSTRLSGACAIKILAEPVPDEQDTSPFSIDRFSIIQLSSGTTGLRKPVEFTSAALFRHAFDYNSCLKLTGDDTIVSWLPLYHDMGYIACFVVPLILGTRVVMMDPESWVNDKAMLFRAIQEYSGTICYMPNFGFEVMRGVPAAAMDHMRLWISCSEPVWEHTSRKFLQHVGAQDENFSACYAMAENVFAMTQSVGIKTREILGTTVVSCGKPIKDVEIKCIEGELWVRSPTSITRYMSGENITDEEGFYPTGDLGEIIDGEIYITGRKRDLMIQAGKKYLLSSIDDVVNQVVPDARGRLATLDDYDERLATSKAIVLIESKDFFLRNDHSEIAAAISDRCQLQYLEVHFVPPRFLTKTSSGKINRVLSLKHWHAVRKAKDERHTRNPAQEIAAEFRQMPFDRPVAEVLDSLAATVLRIILADTGIGFDPQLTLAEYVALAARTEKKNCETGTEHRGLHILSLADRRIFKKLKEEHLQKLSNETGTAIGFEHACLPPSPVLLSDLIFLDYFLPRLDDQEPYSILVQLREKLRSASLLLIDDAAELHFPLRQCYPVLSHRFERSADADLLAFRWQEYTRNHERLPIAVLSGQDLDLADRNQSIRMLSLYLDVPIIRIATVSSLETYTEEWDYISRQSLSGGPGLRPVDPTDFIGFLAEWILTNQPKESSRPLSGDLSLCLNDLPHFCSHYVNQSALDAVLGKFQRFCIAGSKSSIRYITRRLDEELGKSYCRITSPSAAAIEATEAHECLIVCGPTIAVEHTLPVAYAMGGPHGPVMLNTTDPVLRDLHFRGTGTSCDCDEWFHLSRIDGQTTDLEQVRMAIQKALDERELRRNSRKSKLQKSQKANALQPETNTTDTMSHTDTPNTEDRKAELLERRKEERREQRREERREQRKADRTKERQAK